jgi:hypothetical protein
MPTIEANQELIAYCGLYCGACGAYLKGRCPGCRKNVKASWCRIRGCCAQHEYTSCAECTQHTVPNECTHFDNVFSKLIGWVLNSNREACILMLRHMGRDRYASFMAEHELVRLPRRGRVPGPP